MAAGWHCLEELKFVTIGDDHVSDNDTLFTSVAAAKQLHSCKSHQRRSVGATLGSCKPVILAEIWTVSSGYPMTEVQKCVM